MPQGKCRQSPDPHLIVDIDVMLDKILDYLYTLPAHYNINLQLKNLCNVKENIQVTSARLKLKNKSPDPKCKTFRYIIG